MPSQIFERLYLPADFTSLIGGPFSGAVNLAVLQAALLVAMPTTDFLAEIVGPNTVRIQSNAIPPTSEIAALDAAIAAHTGFATTSALQSLTSDAPTTNGTNVYAPKQTAGVDDVFVSAPMNGGPYELIVTGRPVMNVVNTATGAAVILRATTGPSISAANEQAHTEASFASSTVPQLYTMQDIIQLVAGAVLRVQFTFKRLGASGIVTASHVRIRLVAL